MTSTIAASPWTRASPQLLDHRAHRHGKSTLADRILEDRHGCRARHARTAPRLDGPRAGARDHDQGAGRARGRGRVTSSTSSTRRVTSTSRTRFRVRSRRARGRCSSSNAAQGIEAQTLANAYLAIENGLEIVPVVNKIDLPSADPERALRRGRRPARRRSGEGPAHLREDRAQRHGRPRRDRRACSGSRRRHRRAAARSSSTPRTDQYRGCSRSSASSTARSRAAKRCGPWRRGPRFDAEELGFFSPTMTPVESLSAGEVGYVVTGLKDVSALRVGDTITVEAGPRRKRCRGTRT